MTKEELIDFLRENLTVDLHLNEMVEAGSMYLVARIDLKVGDETISNVEDSVWLR